MGKSSRNRKKKNRKQKDYSSLNGESHLNGRSRTILSRATLAIVLGLLVLSVIIYGRTLTYDITNLDDRVLIFENKHFLSDPANIYEAFKRPMFPISDGGTSYYRPLVIISYILDAQWNNAEPFAFHVTNLILHAGAGVLLFFLLGQMGYTAGISAAAAALFIAHPALTTTVAWIPGRNDSLLALWSFAMLYSGFRLTGRPRPQPLTTHLFFYSMALMTKETAIILPLVCILYGYLWRSDTRQPVPSRALIGWVVLTVLFFGIRHIALTDGNPVDVSKSIANAVVSIPTLFQYLSKLFLPIDLSPIAIPQDTHYWPGVAGVLLIGVAWVVFPGHRRRIVFGALLCVLFLIPCLPASHTLILENRLYLPLVGVLIVGVEMARGIRERFFDQTQWMVPLPFVVVGVLATVSFHYAGYFSDPLAFHEKAVKASPHSALAHSNLGTAYHRKGDLAEAERHYLKTIALNPFEPVVRNNLALIFLNRGELDKAEDHLCAELEINSRYDKAHFNLGLVLERRGKRRAAEQSYERAVEMNPDNTDALLRLMRFAYERRDEAAFLRYKRELMMRGFTFPEPQN